MTFDEALRALHELLGELVVVSVGRWDDPSGHLLTIAAFGGRLRSTLEPSPAVALQREVNVAHGHQIVFWVDDQASGPQSYFILRESAQTQAQWNLISDPPLLVIETAGMTVSVSPWPRGHSDELRSRIQRAHAERRP